MRAVSSGDDVVKLVSFVLLTVSHAAHFGTIGPISIAKPRRDRLQLGGQKSEEPGLKNQSRLKRVANACAWLED